MKKRQRFAALLLAAGMTVSVAAPLGAAAETTDKTADMTAFYQEWKSKYVRQNPYVTDETQYYVYYSEDTGDSFRGARLRDADRRFHGGL